MRKLPRFAPDDEAHFDIPIAISDIDIVTIVNLPVGLMQKQARKICAVIMALAAPAKE